MSVLVVDDDQRLRELLDEYLTRQGFQVRAVPDGAAGLAALAETPPALVILDLMMPGMDGLETCRRIRSRSEVPIIMLTAKGEETDRIVGLELGADDYLPKPFNPRELLARMRAVLRRSRGEEGVEGEVLEAKELRLDLGARRVHVGGREIELTSTEFDLLRVLVQSAGRVVPRDGLMERARGTDFAAFDRSIDVHISHIRRKLGDDPRRPRLLKTIRGVGYMVTKP
jgi:two-component system, OmpR family, phosphate regulon response regulator OmpR